jgi:flagellar motor switch/type III secretory pathway protein FliN
METVNKKKPENKKTDLEAYDPFARDFFNNARKPTRDVGIETRDDPDDREPEAHQLKFKSDWTQSLPKITVQELNFSNEIISLPDDLSNFSEETVQEVFSNLTLKNRNQIFCKALSSTEVRLEQTINLFRKTNHIFITMYSKSPQTSGIIGINSEFASTLVNLVLGGTGNQVGNFKSLSEIEKAIIEFIIIKLFGSLNEKMGRRVFMLGKIEDKPGFEVNPEERGAEIVFDLVVGNTEGTFTVFLPENYLNVFNTARDVLFKSDKSGTPAELKIFPGGFETHIKLFETSINFGDLSVLEQNDVILVDRPGRFQEIFKENSPPVKVFVGDGNNVFLEGNLMQQNMGDKNLFSGALSFEITSLISQKENKSGMNKGIKMNEGIEKDLSNDPATQMDEKLENTGIVSGDNLFGSEKEQEEAGLESLENIYLNLSVQIKGKRLSLSELQNLRVGQIIDLGCRPTDPFEIVIDSDNKTIALGELVEIEGQIGVRLSKIFV